MAAEKKKIAAPKKTPSHPSYKEMVMQAVVNLKERNGSSRQAIKKWIHANFKDLNPNADLLINQAIKKGVESKDFIQPKGPSGPVKAVKKTVGEPKPAAAPIVKKPAKVEKPVASPKKKVVKTVTKPATPTKKKSVPAIKKAPAPKKATKAASVTPAEQAKPKRGPPKTRKPVAAKVAKKKATVTKKTKASA